MLPSPVPADPGWDEDLAWLDRDPEREVWLARAREHDEPPGEDEDDESFEPFTAEELLAYCRQNLSTLKCPRSIDFEAELPRHPTGKLYKRLLRDRYWRGRESRIV